MLASNSVNNKSSSYFYTSADFQRNRILWWTCSEWSCRVQEQSTFSQHKQFGNQKYVYSLLDYSELCGCWEDCFAVSISLQNVTFVFTLAVGLPIPWPQLSVLWPWAAPPRPDRWPGHHRLRWGHHEAQRWHQVRHHHSRWSQGRRSVKLSPGLSSCRAKLCV